MAYPKELNNLYKEEKAAGLTTAKSFPEWHKLYKDSQLAQFVPPVEEFVDDEFGMDIKIEPLTEDQLDALEAMLSQDEYEEEEYSSEEIEAGYMGIKLNDAQIAAIVNTLNPAEVSTEVVVPISKAAHARSIYDQMEQTAITTKIALVRKDIINRFVAELPISKVGAATYLQNIKTKKGLVRNK